MSTLVLSIAQSRTITVINDTLFGVAARELGDAAQWTRIAKINGLTDPWITGSRTLVLPPVEKKQVFDGVLT